MPALLLLPLGGIAALLFLLLCLHEFRVRVRVKAASTRLEDGKARPGYLYEPGRRLPR